MFNARTAEVRSGVVIWHENPEDFNYDLLNRKAGFYRPAMISAGRNRPYAKIDLTYDFHSDSNSSRTRSF